MNFKALKDHCMFQIRNDLDDLSESLDYLNHYLNEGYDILLGAWDTGAHIGDEKGAAYPVLVRDSDVPGIPYWAHRYIADYATWLLYRNGNPQRQQRGMRYWEWFNMGLGRLQSEGGKEADEIRAAGGDPHRIVNVYPDRPVPRYPEAAEAGFDPLA